MKRFLKSFVSLALAASISFGSALVYTGVGAVSVYAEDTLDISISTGSMEGSNTAVDGDGHIELKFYAPSLQNLNAAKNAGYTKFVINYEIYNYTASGTAGAQSFLSCGKMWELGNWTTIDEGSKTGSVYMDISSFDDSTNNAYYGIQFCNMTGTVSYKITSAKLVKDGSSSGGNSGGGSQTSDTIEDVNGDVELNYAKLLQESLYFYDANMCGTDVDENSLFSWRNDCHTDDVKATYNGRTIDLSGGYHDAGDHVKFGLPAAFSASMLGVSYMEYKNIYDDYGITAHYKRIMDRFVDYFERCTVMDSNGKVETFCYQVGEGNADHESGCSPEKQTGSRPVYFTSASDPCTDIVCETAAALAIYSINFNDEKALEYAKALFEYAQTNPNGLSKGREERNIKFYHSGSYDDDRAFAAAMLYRATSDNNYKTIYDNINNSGGLNCGWPASWDDIKALAVMYPPNGGMANSKVSEYVNERALYSKKPDGYVVVDGWGSARYNASLQFLGLLSDKRTGSDNFGEWAEGQMSYLLGNNSGKHCFVIGYNQFSVKNPHHRAVYDLNDFAKGQDKAKHILLGALVGGPGDMASNYTDSVTDFNQNEVALDYNACLVCAAAALCDYKLNKGTDEEKALQSTVDVTKISNIELRTFESALKGDVNNDGTVDTKDALAILNHASGLELLEDTSNADMNNDGKIDLIDAVLLSK